MDQSAISVVIADDHPVFRSGMESVVRSDTRLQLLESCKDGREALDSATRLSPDVLLLDMSMPEMDGLQVATALIAANSSTRILPLSGHTEPEYVMGALEAGVRGYLLKDEKPSIILSAIVNVANGGVYVSPGLMGVGKRSGTPRFVSQNEARERFLKDAGITPRLFEVLLEAAQGKSNQEIGDTLFKSPHTVRNQIETLKSIAGVTSRPALVAWAWRNKLINSH